MESKKLTEEQFGKIKEAACQTSEQEFTNMVLDCIVEDGGLKSLNPKTDIPMMHKLITQCSYSEFDDLVENGNLPAIKLSAEETELLKAGNPWKWALGAIGVAIGYDDQLSKAWDHFAAGFNGATNDNIP